MSKNHNVNRKQIVSILMLAVMILNLLPTIPFESEAAAAPAYIASIGIAQDKHESDAKNELSGHTIINRDLNDDAGGDYVYIGYKTSTDPSKAITGIVFRVGENPPDSITYGGYTFNLVGGRYEANTAVDNVVDLNEDAGGAYIYTYVTRDPNYGPALTAMTVNESSSYSGWITGTNTGGGVIDLNQSAGGDYLYLHYQRYSATIKATYYYIDGNGSRKSTTLSKTAKNHLDTLTGAPDIPEAKYNGRSWTFLGWRDDDNMDVYEYSGNNISVSVSESGKVFRAQYYAFSGIGYNANGGSTPPSIVYFIGINLYACSSSIKGGYTDYTLERYNNPTHPTKCKFLGWSESSYASSATYADGGTIRITKSGYDIYAVWDPTHTPGGSYTNLGVNHSYVCTDCGKTVEENHSYNSTTQLCICGAENSEAVASLSKNGKVVAAYLSLNDAIQAAASSTASDAAVVTILQNIALGNNYQEITSGVFTIDLNGHEISNANSVRGVFDIEGEATNVTIKGDGENSKITGQYAGIEISRAALTITGGSISGNTYGVGTNLNSTVTINGGSISGVYAYGNSTVTITDGTISNANFGVYARLNSTVTVSGGSISGNVYDIGNNSSAITLTLGEGGAGAAFPGGIKALGTTMNAILGEGAAYWQGDIMIIPADDAAEITGDVVIKATCPHTASKSHYADLNNGTNHGCVCTGCNNIITETHSYTNYVCVCGAVDSNVAVASATVGGVTAYHLTLNSAIQAVKDCTADDKAVVTILQNVALGNTCQGITSGVFTIDLNGHEISNTNSYRGVFDIEGKATNVTIKGDGENSKITGQYAGIEIFRAALTITGGNISGNSYGVYATGNSTVTINGGSISGSYVVYVQLNSTVTINGGSISGFNGVYAKSNSTVTISGGIFSGNYGVTADNSTLTISDGTISSFNCSVKVYDGTVTISGGTINGRDYGVEAHNSTVTVSGGNISSDRYGVYAYNKSTVTVSGGSISGSIYDICNNNSAITLTLGEDGVGATFPGGITVDETTLNEILGEGAACWQGDIMIIPADDATEISGGDVTIKAKVDCVNVADYVKVGYAVSGQVVTVSSEKACKVGYISEGAYTEIDAVDNGDGSYSFTAPEGVDEVILVIKGDANLDRRVTAADIARVNAGILGKTTLTSVEIFAGDVDGNGTLTVSEDIETIKSDVLRREALAW